MRHAQQRGTRTARQPERYRTLRILSALVLIVAAAVVVDAATRVSAKALDAGTILNSGSTNSAPFQLVARADGTATFTIEGRPPEKRTLPVASVREFLLDLKASIPFEASKGGCMKSASFGSSTYVIYHGHRSPDISCGNTLRERTLMTDVNRIALEAKIPTLIPRIRTFAPPSEQPAQAPSAEASAEPAPSPAST